MAKISAKKRQEILERVAEDFFQDLQDSIGEDSPEMLIDLGIPFYELPDPAAEKLYYDLLGALVVRITKEIEHREEKGCSPIK